MYAEEEEAYDNLYEVFLQKCVKWIATIWNRVVSFNEDVKSAGGPSEIWIKEACYADFLQADCNILHPRQRFVLFYIFTVLCMRRIFY
jgi:hypothetical protein